MAGGVGVDHGEVEHQGLGDLGALVALHLGAEGLDRRRHLDALHLAVWSALLAALLVLSEEHVGRSGRIDLENEKEKVVV